MNERDVELSFSRDGGKTWEAVGFVGSVSLTDLDLPPEPDEVLLVGRGPIVITGELRIISGSFPCLSAVTQVAEPNRADRPWLRPGKGRGRQL